MAQADYKEEIEAILAFTKEFVKRMRNEAKLKADLAAREAEKLA